LLLIIFLIELYTYSGITPYINQLDNNWYWFAYYLLAALSVVSAIVFVNGTREKEPGFIKKPSSNILSGLALTLILTKLSFVAVIFAEDVFRLSHLVTRAAVALFQGTEHSVEMYSRSVYMAKLGLGVAAIPLISFVHGITIGKYKYRVKKVRLTFNDLPNAFDGYKILQFSDMHAGSFDSIKRVKKGMDKMQEQGADLILFTGDMVNNHADEIKPFIQMLSELKAADGKYSILGNHDYGDYMHWASSDAKIHNLYKLISHQESAGFNMLLNENVEISRGNDSIRLVGVENWGKPPFPTHGDLKKGLEGMPEEAFTVLMSHDPSHWDLEVIKNKKMIHLTLSGHTHGMQLGFDIPGLKWSPVKYKYPRWSGLYQELGRKLYVNNGFGFLGFPGRVGIYPEITVLELCSEKN
jgi:predicted MPP superfamily phosphohydrolase